jgi:hypothetical protein
MLVFASKPASAYVLVAPEIPYCFDRLKCKVACDSLVSKRFVNVQIFTEGEWGIMPVILEQVDIGVAYFKGIERRGNTHCRND